MPAVWYVLSVPASSVPARARAGATARRAAQVADQARAAAAAAAHAAGVEVRKLDDNAALRAAAELFADVWRPVEPVPFELLRAMRHSGTYVGGAYRGTELVGAAAGLLADDGSLHSHILAVRPAARGRRVGFAVKLHQRSWALERGITTVTWTFDPLVRRNAQLNLVTLAARAEGYLEDFYGAMGDDLNAGAPSDRLLVSWPLTEADVAAAAEGARRFAPEPDAQTVLLLSEGAAGEPATAATPDQQVPPAGPAEHGSPAGQGGPLGSIPRPAPGRPPLRLAVGTPADITTLRARRPELAAAWRYAQRETLGSALAAGYRITGLTRSGRYLLEADRPGSGPAAAGAGPEAESPAPGTRPAEPPEAGR
jgi:predicted GNAT superfamily acetyltransferase